MPESLRVTRSAAEISSPSSELGPIGKYRWVICALLFFATTINYIDRQILSLIKEILDKQIGWSNEQFGWVNSAFQLAYGVGLLGFGWFVDRFGTKIGYAVSIAAWSVAATGHALVGSVAGFITARACLGLGEAGNFPSAIKAVALWFPKRERAFATSIFNAGTNAGALIAPAVIPWLAYKFGWQSAFIAAAIAGGLWLFLWLPFYDTPDKSSRVSRAELTHIYSDKDEAVSQMGNAVAGSIASDGSQPGQAPGSREKIPWTDLLAYRQTWSFILAKFFTDPVWWFFLIWLPDFFKKTRDLDIKKSWIHIVTIYGIITILSLFGGWITGFLTEKGWSVTRARKTGMFFFALCVLPILAVTHVGDWTAVLLIGLAGSAHQAWSANLFTTVSDMFPKSAVASVVGIGGMAGSAGGFIFPILTGRMLDHFGKQHNVTAGYAILFGICACAYLVAFLLNHICAPRFEPLHVEHARR
jgi:MFS transporter, ACS family, hexuronate transporter